MEVHHPRQQRDDFVKLVEQWQRQSSMDDRELFNKVKECSTLPLTLDQFKTRFKRPERHKKHPVELPHMQALTDVFKQYCPLFQPSDKDKLFKLAGHSSLEKIETMLSASYGKPAQSLFYQNDGSSAPVYHNTFDTLIEQKSRDFVGRKHILDAFDAFTGQNESGYFVIVGDPGVGKTSLIAHYAKKRKAIVYFNRRLQHINSVEAFLHYMYPHLMQQYNIRRPIPSHAYQNGTFFNELLNEISHVHVKPGSEPIVITIDALDEVEHYDTSGVNLLLLPEVLPKGIFIVMTSRSIDLPLRLEKCAYYRMNEHKEDNDKDIALYVEQQILKQELKAWLQQREIDPKEFKRILVERSETNFMYVYHLLREIPGRLYNDLTLLDIPQGLINFYELHWRRMGMTKSSARIQPLIIYAMVVYQTPITPNQIAHITKQDPYVVSHVLDTWREFLHTVQEGRHFYYRFYHSSFEEFLKRQEIIQISGIDVTALKDEVSRDLIEKWGPHYDK